MILLWIAVNMRMGMKITNHCILYMSFNEWTVHKRMIFLFAKATTINCENLGC
jgi:hypothetical protein